MSSPTCRHCTEPVYAVHRIASLDVDVPLCETHWRNAVGHHPRAAKPTAAERAAARKAARAATYVRPLRERIHAQWAAAGALVWPDPEPEVQPCPR